MSEGSKRRSWFNPRWSEDDALWAVATGRAVRDPANASRAVEEGRKIARATSYLLVGSVVAIALSLLLLEGYAATSWATTGVVGVMFAVGEGIQARRSIALNQTIVHSRSPEVS